MATNTKPKKTKWYKTIIEAFRYVRKNDPVFLPVFLVMVVLISGGGIALGFLTGNHLASHLYSNFLATMLLLTGTLALLTTRIDRATFSVYAGTLGGSLAAVQTIRRGWKFADDPIEIDAKGKAAVFQGVGKGGIVLIGEGGAGARRAMQNARARLNRIVPGVPVHEFYAGKGHGELPLRKLVKAIKHLKRSMSKRERFAIEARLHALGGTRVPVPKGIDPMRARPDRKALRGR